jgi:hypothetical protein
VDSYWTLTGFLDSYWSPVGIGGGVISTDRGMVGLVG